MGRTFRVRLFHTSRRATVKRDLALSVASEVWAPLLASKGTPNLPPLQTWAVLQVSFRSGRLCKALVLLAAGELYLMEDVVRGLFAQSREGRELAVPYGVLEVVD